MPPDLTAAREVARAQLVDACDITFDSAGVADDTIDSTTLELTRPAGDAPSIYTGPCLVGPSSDVEAETGGGYVAASRRTVRLPFDAVLPPIGAVLKVTSSAGEPALVNTTYRIISAEPRSIYVTRVIEVERALPVASA